MIEKLEKVKMKMRKKAINTINAKRSAAYMICSEMLEEIIKELKNE